MEKLNIPPENEQINHWYYLLILNIIFFIIFLNKWYAHFTVLFKGKDWWNFDHSVENRIFVFLWKMNRQSLIYMLSKFQCFATLESIKITHYINDCTLELQFHANFTSCFLTLCFFSVFRQIRSVKALTISILRAWNFTAYSIYYD